MDIKVTEKEAGITIKDYLFKHLKLSVASVKRVKYRENGITVNGEHKTVRYVLCLGDELSLWIEDEEEDENEYTVPVDIPIDIAYEDEYLTVVNKPPFMPAHPSLGHKGDTVANALAYRYRDKPFVFRAVNRLDRDTSGLMLVARDKISAHRMYKAMIDKEIKKNYTAVLNGIIEPEKGRIETYMCRKGESIVERCVCDADSSGAQLAITEYETVEVINGMSVVRAIPVTGRTHQLRVHFAHKGHYIVGDTMYGEESHLINRQALHASYLEFVHPRTDELIKLQSPLPDDMNALLK